MKIKKSYSLACSSYLMEGDGRVPNSKFPALIFHGAINFEGATIDQVRDQLKRLVEKNGWYLDWTDSVYWRTHYHSTAHEALIVWSGKPSLQLGGRKSLNIRPVQPGDVIFIPAGVGHKRVDSTEDFTVFGLYPYGQEWDLQWGWRKNYNDCLQRIAKVPLPDKDPVFGKDGIKWYWGWGPK